MKLVGSIVDRRHIYMSGSGYYRHRFNISPSCIITVTELHTSAAVKHINIINTSCGLVPTCILNTYGVVNIYNHQRMLQTLFLVPMRH